MERGGGLAECPCYYILSEPYFVKWFTKEGGGQNAQKLFTKFITLIIAFCDFTSKFYWMGLREVKGHFWTILESIFWSNTDLFEYERQKEG